MTHNAEKASPATPPYPPLPSELAALRARNAKLTQAEVLERGRVSMRRLRESLNDAEKVGPQMHGWYAQMDWHDVERVILALDVALATRRPRKKAA